jgi:hypothetical protein
MLQTILAAAQRPAPIAIGPGGFIFGAIAAVSMLLVTVGIFYILIKLGGFIDALTEAAKK